MSDEIPTPRMVDATNGDSVAEIYVAVLAEGMKLERELVTAQSRIRELEAASWQRTPVQAHRTCSQCHQFLPAPLFPNLAGNETVCCRCYWPCGESKT